MVEVTTEARRPAGAPARDDAVTGVVTVRFFAGARAAAGVAAEEVPLNGAGTVIEVLGALSDRHGAALTRVLAAASLLLDEVAVRDKAQRLPAGSTLDVLPPFAGG